MPLPALAIMAGREGRPSGLLLQRDAGVEKAKQIPIYGGLSA